MPGRRSVCRRRVASVLAAVLAAVLGTTLGGCAPPSPDVGPSTPRAVLGFAVGGGIQDEPATRRDADLDGMRALGARWVRFDIAWVRVQPDGPDRYDWAALDATVAAARARGLSVLGTLAYTPAWARDPACRDTPTCRPVDVDRFTAFVRAAVAHYAPRGVHHWEIWNEPNTRNFYKPAPDPGGYARMLRAAHAAAHAADPRAVVVSGGLSPAATGDGDIAPVDFLARLYAAGGRGSFDALGHHPYCYDGGRRCPTTRARWSAWAQLTSTRRSLRGLMSAHGDAGKQVWLTEYGAPTGGESAVSEAEQARIILVGLAELADVPWAGPAFVYAYRDAGTDPRDREDWFGVVTASGQPKAAARRLEELAAGPGRPSEGPAPG